MVLIKAVHITKEFDGIVALRDVSLSVEPQEILGIIGPNGAGKTTLLNIINGIFPPDRGEVFIQGHRINGLAPYRVAQLGLTRTFQITRIFQRMTIMENLLVATINQLGRSQHAIDRALGLLRSVGLAVAEDQYAEELSGGQRKLLEFARALMPDPQVVLMDEPFAGIHPEIKSTLIQGIRKMHEKGKTFLIVSHDIDAVRDLCQRVVVLSYGEKIAEGSTEEVLHNEAVIEAYLGRE